MRLALICICSVIACVLAVAQEETQPTIRIAKISLPDPVYTGMPIWMKVESPTGYKIHYPSSTTPNDFYCNEVEVKQDGRLLRPLVGLTAAGRAGAVCGWLGIADIAESTLPIHLQYTLTEPGTYMVRFTRREYRRAKPDIAEQSEWVPLHLKVTPPEMMERWLRGQIATLPVSPGRLLGNALPSLLASRDPRVLRLMIETSYNADPAVAGYAANSLEMFDIEEVRTQLLPVLADRGPNDALGYLFTSSRIAVPIATQIVAASLPYLQSSAPQQVEGAVHILSMMDQPFFHLPSETLARISSAIQADVDFVVAQKNEKAARWIATFLGSTRPPASRALLWKLIDAGLATEQSLICITWIRDPADLPRIAAIVKQDNRSDPHGYEHSSVVMHMQTQYGTMARPYLRDILASSKQTWVRTSAAQGLVQMNDRAGWEFFIEVIRQRPFYRDEMVRWLGDLFPEIRGKDDSTIVPFLESKMTTATAKE